MKLNNKGFAISTLIYGLSVMGMMLIAILMGIMSVNRANNRSLSNEIEEDLNRFSRTSTTFAAAANGQEFTVPIGESGWYRIELWGASGGSGSGGKGAYTVGVIELEEEDKLYFYVGDQGSGGGGSTDVRLLPAGSTASEKQKSYNSRIMVAAGGGQSAGANGGTLKGYNNSMIAQDGKLNLAPTGLFGLASGTTNLVGYPSNYAPVATDTSHYAMNTPVSQGNGGSGYHSSTSASVGGISFIAGYPGCKGFNFDTNNYGTWNNPGVNFYIQEYDEETNQNVDVLKNFYFVDGMMFSGVNKGKGKAKIERIVRKSNDDQKLVRINQKLNSVSSITDCVGNSDYDASKTIVSAVYQGVEKAPATASSISGKCATFNFSATPLDEIAVWHAAGKDYTDHTITVNGSVKLKAASSMTINSSSTTKVTLSETETPTGFHISAYQPDMTGPLPASGNYYIMPVLTENKVVTAENKNISEEEQSDSSHNHNPIMVQYINGYKKQKWNIQLITDTSLYDSHNPYNASNSNTFEYKIIELAKFKALNILDDENKFKNQIGAALEFNNKQRNAPQIWKIKPVGNGTYVIATVVPRFSTSIDTGNIFAQMTSGADGYQEIIIGRINNNTERFKLISIDYSSVGT